MNNILYVFDEKATGGKCFQDCKSNNRIFACPLITNQDFISTTLQKLRVKRKQEVTSIPFVHYFNEKAFSIRKNFIRFITDFAEMPIVNEKNLKEYFKSPFENFSTWWFSLIAEKNTLKTNSYHNLVKLLTILDIQEKYACNEIWLDIGDREITQAITNYFRNIGLKCIDLKNHRKKPEFIYFALIFKETIAHLLYIFRRLVLIKKIMRELNNRKKILRDSQYLLVTYFPLVNKEAIKQERFVNRYYQPLQNALEEKYKGKFSWLAMIVSNPDFGFKKSITLAKQIDKWNQNFFLSQEWLTPWDFFMMAFQYSYITMKFFLKLPFISQKFSYPIPASSNLSLPASRQTRQDALSTRGGVNIWPLFKKDWYRSFCGWILIDGLLHYRIFTKVFSQLKEDTIITYFAENHAWEKALNVAAHKKGRLKVIGIQHTIVSLLHLMYFNHKTELQYKNDIQTMPKPDFLACVGKMPAEFFQKMGWNENRVFVWGAIRFQHFKHLLKHNTPWNNRENKVVIALSISDEESKEVLLYAYQAFKNNPYYQVIIKGHPFLFVSSLVESLNIKLNANIFKIVDTPLNKLLPTAKALVAAGSSASLEGIACQCPVIIPRLAGTVDMNPLSGISDLPIYVESPENLRKVVDEIMDREDSPISYEKCRTFIENYCEFLDSDEEFLRRLERKVNV